MQGWNSPAPLSAYFSTICWKSSVEAFLPLKVEALLEKHALRPLVA